MTLEPDNARVEVVDKQTNIRNVSVIGNGAQRLAACPLRT